MVESPTKYKAPVRSLAADEVVQFLPLQSQVSALSSVLLSPNRVRQDFTYDTWDVFPVFQVSQENVLPIVTGHVTGFPEHTEFTGHTGSRLSAK